MGRRVPVAALLVLLLAAPARPDDVVRCGRGWLERVDGYPVLHLRGTPYEMGFQHGSLLRKECLSLLQYLFEVKQREATLRVFGREVTPRDAVALIFALEKPFIPPRFLEEMRGLADALGVDVSLIHHANLIPELFHCSGFALLSAVTEPGTLLHGRVLDYGTDWRLQEHAVLIVAEPEGGIPFVNVSYAGFIGSVTGMNAKQVSIGEMGGGGLGFWMGTPMSFLVRRVLEEAEDLDGAVAIFRDARRTCQYFYVVADGEADDAVGLEASARRFAVIRPGEAEARLPAPVKDTVLLSAGDRYRELARRVAWFRDAGKKVGVADAIRLMDAPVAMRSNLHNVLMAPALGRLWVANAAADGRPAWTQPYHEFRLGDLLAGTPPASSPELPAPPDRR